jgi:2-methylisocitrate lyase-like PEP mutase family enzyme
MTSQSARLRELLAAPGLIPSPGVWDGISAQVAAEAGFELLYMTGSGVSLGTHGLPDVGLLTLTEMAEACRRITSATSLPVIADADTGYGNAVNAQRTIREFENAGASGVQFEDQISPKKCSHLSGREVIDAEEMCLKIAAAAEARRDPDFLIIARTDARESHGIDEAIRRCQAYREAGADILFATGPEGEAELARIPREVDAPCLLVVAWGAEEMAPSKLEEMGFKIAVYPGELQRISAFAMREAAKILKDKGSLESIAGRMLTYPQRFDLAGYEAIRKTESKFLPAE